MTKTVEEQKEEQQVPITMESIEQKMDKGEDLTQDEELFLLQNDSEPVEGYANTEVKDMDPNDFDEEEEKDPADKPKEEQQKKETEDKDKSKEDKKESDPKEEEEKDPLFKIERELAKPENEADLTGFTERERSYYHQMKRDRLNRQKAEKELASANLKIQEFKKEPPKKEEPDDPMKDLDGKDDSDYMTVADVKALMKKQGDRKPKDPEQPESQGRDPFMINYLKMAEKEAQSQFSDFDIVLELSDDIIRTNQQYLQEITTAVRTGINPAVRTYELIKGDPEFAKLYPAAESRFRAKQAAKKSDTAPSSDKDEKTPKEEPKESPKQSEEDAAKEAKAKQAQEALKSTRRKTTGNLGGGGTEENFAGHTAEQIAGMSQLEFNHLPKKERDRYLKLYG